MLQFIAAREIEVVSRGFPDFLDKPVQQNHPLQTIDVEKYPCGPILAQICPDFVNSIHKRPANWHTYGPSEFNRLNVFADTFSVLV